jgi:hypothetical protein
MRKTLAAACVLVAVFAAAACTRSVDPAAANATLVPGTSSLYRFCDEANLIYFSKVDGDSDQFEFFIPGGCQLTTPTPTPPPTSASAIPGANGGGR